jgi:hypothetical protein
MKGPKQVLRAAILWEEGVPLEQLPYFFDDKHARPENSQKCRVSVVTVPTRVWCKRCQKTLKRDISIVFPCPVRRPVLYVPGQCLEVRHGYVARAYWLKLSCLDASLADIIYGGDGGGRGGWIDGWREGGREGGRERGSWRWLCG